MNQRSTALLAVAIAVTACVATPVALVRHDRSPAAVAAPAERVAPLSVADRKVLSAGRQLIDDLKEAFAEVPRAAADAANIDPTLAHAELAGTPALRALTAAADGRSAAVATIVAGYRGFSEHRTAVPSEAFSRALATLSMIEGSVVPAIRYVAVQHGRRLSAAEALAAVDRDTATAALARMLADWSQIYGLLVLVEQGSERA